MAIKDFTLRPGEPLDVYRARVTPLGGYGPSQAEVDTARLAQGTTRDIRFQGGEPASVLREGANQSGDVGSQILTLLRQYQQFGQQTQTQAEQEQVKRLSFTPPELIGASPDIQAGARNAAVGALTPTIGGAKDVLSQAKDLITKYTQVQEKQRDDARALFNSALGAGSQAVKGLLEQQPDLLKLAGLNPETAKFFVTAKEAEEERKRKEGLTDYQKTTTFNTIVDKYNKSPLIEAADRTASTASLISTLEKNPGSRENQLIAIYQFIQILDNYQSAVREGEIGLLTGASSLREKIETSIQKLNTGQAVNPNVVLDITRGLKTLIQSIGSAASKKAQSFRAQAQVAGVGQEFENYLSQFTPAYQEQTEQTIQKGEATFRKNPNGTYTRIK